MFPPPVAIFVYDRVNGYPNSIINVCNGLLWIYVGYHVTLGFVVTVYTLRLHNAYLMAVIKLFLIIYYTS